MTLPKADIFCFSKKKKKKAFPHEHNEGCPVLMTCTQEAIRLKLAVIQVDIILAHLLACLKPNGHHSQYPSSGERQSDSDRSSYGRRCGRHPSHTYSISLSSLPSHTPASLSVTLVGSLFSYVNIFRKLLYYRPVDPLFRQCHPGAYLYE